ncbi:MAG: Delta-60 repeat-containing protein [Verrucomicrobiales bacterium]|nr:Delta-60 repeat-containing protein [Verrucomicrobiales bacterium]
MKTPLCYLFLTLLLMGGLDKAKAQSSLLDTSFTPGSGASGGFVETLLQQPDGKILICGNFTSFNGASVANVARLNSNGTVDTTFNANPGYWVRHMVLQPDGKIVIGGFFKSVGTQSRSLIARLNSNGSLDTTFDPGTGADGTLGTSITGNPDPFIFQLALQSDGKILITGNFTNYNGTVINGIARINSNGSLDTTFHVGSGLSTWGRSIQVLPNNQILVTGWFDNYNNSSHDRMALINPDGSPDASFHPYFGDRTAVYTAVKLPDGKYIAAGHSLNYSGLFTNEIRRLNIDGTTDESFTGKANEKIQSVKLQSDGKLVIVGEFTLVDGVGRTTIARLNPDGSLDTGFSANIDSWGWTGGLQPDGKILFCGGFSKVDNTSRSGIARLLSATGDAQPLIFNPNKIGNTFSTSVSTLSGKTYTLQYKNSLQEVNWTSLTPSVNGDGTSKTLSDASASVETRLYRIQMK